MKKSYGIKRKGGRILGWGRKGKKDENYKNRERKKEKRERNFRRNEIKGKEKERMVISYCM